MMKLNRAVSSTGCGTYSYPTRWESDPSQLLVSTSAVVEATNPMSAIKP